MRYAEHWQGEDGVWNVVRGESQGRYPDGDILNTLREIIPDLPVVDVGCGYGRLCEAFPLDEYVGLDCNLHALKLARDEFPNYDFRHVSSYDYPESPSKLVYAVACHIPPEELLMFIGELCRSTTKRIFLIEHMGSDNQIPLRTKPDGGMLQPFFGRNSEEYIELFAACGFKLTKKHYMKYRRHEKSTILRFLKEPS